MKFYTLLTILLLCLALKSFGGTYRTPVFATAEVKPWGFTTDQGAMDGALIRFTKKLHDEVGIPYRNSIMPYARVIHALKAGEINFAVLLDGINLGPEVTKISRILTAEIILVGGKDSIPIDSLAELTGKSVGHIRGGGKFGRTFEDATNFTKYPVKNMQQGLTMLLAGRLHAFASVDQTLFYAMQHLSVETEEIHRLLTLGEVSMSLYMSSHSPLPEISKKYSAAIKQMYNNGIPDKFFKTTPEASPFLSQ